MPQRGKIMVIMIGATSGLFGIVKLFKKQTSEACQKDLKFIEAIEILQNHKGALKFLGEPIEIQQTEFASSGIGSPDKYETKTRVKGSKSNGIVFISVIKHNGLNKLDSVQLQIGKDDSKRLLIKESEIQEKN